MTVPALDQLAPSTPVIQTTQGYFPIAALHRISGFEDRPDEFVIWVEYRLTAGGELVRRDCHVVKKQPHVTAETAAGGLA